MRRGAALAMLAGLVLAGCAQAPPEQTLEECMAVMTEKRVRHLPVLAEGKLAGIVSIGDLVKSRIADQEFIIEQLAHYIHG